MREELHLLDFEQWLTAPVIEFFHAEKDEARSVHANETTEGGLHHSAGMIEQIGSCVIHQHASPEN